MTPKNLNEHIEVTPGVRGGKPRIAGRRITVEDIVISHERLGIDVDTIATEHDLSLADVHAALAYYFDHREAMDEQMNASEKLVAELKAHSTSPLRKKLLDA